MITGQALYEALLSACPDLAYTWKDLGPRDRQIYKQVASALNGQIATSAQKQSGSITGEDVASCLGLRWERFCSSAQVLYEEIAMKLNAQYISPLQGLVRDYYDAALIGKYMEDPSEYDCRTYEEMMEVLLKRTETLLGEQKG